MRLKNWNPILKPTNAVNFETHAIRENVRITMSQIDVKSLRQVTSLEIFAFAFDACS